jgi:putative endonuclease
MNDQSKTQGYVYLLSNNRGTVLYTGSTGDLKKRIYFHKKRLIPGFTKKYNVDKLVYFEVFPKLDQAIERERQIKGKTRAKKNALIRAKNPEYSDLSREL